MPSTAGWFATFLFGLGLLLPVVAVVAGVVFALVTRKR